MISTLRIGIVIVALWAMGMVNPQVGAAPLGTDFSYQGQLKLGGVPVTDTADLEFSLYDAASNGLLVAGPITVSNVAVVDGLFQASLDFGVSVLDGSALWLEIAVRSPHDPGDTLPFTTLDPRQPLTAAPYALQTRGIFVDNAGNVGIGTTSPGFPLHVRDDDAIVQIDTALADGTPWVYYTQQNTLRAAVGYRDENAALTFFVNGSDHMVIEDSGQVGIGTVTPSAGLEIDMGATNDTALQLTSSGAGWGSGMRFENTSGTKFGIYSNNTNELRFVNVDAGVDIMTLNSAGNVGIGVNNPSAALDVVGTTELNGDVTINSNLTVDTDTLFVDGTTGNVGIGTDTPDNKLEIGGTPGVDGIKFPDGTVQTTATSGAVAAAARVRFNNKGLELAVRPIVIDAAYTPASGASGEETQGWQSFTALQSGSLAAVDLMRALTIEDAQVKLYAGEGTAGAVLGAATVPAQAIGQAGIWRTAAFSTPISITAGNKYTIEATSLSMAPSTLKWLYNSSDPYPGGRSDNSPTHDRAFRAWIFDPADNGDLNGALFVDASTGNVGIGTSNPTRGKVEIVGSEPGTFSYGYLNSSGNTSMGNSPHQYSLYATRHIAAEEFNAHSDARIKHVLGRSDSAADLNTLTEIEITDYTLIDTVAKGKERHKKVIGQQVWEVFPQAVTISTDVVPDIYKLADVENGWIILATDLAVGDRVRLITEGNSELYEVLEVRADSFRVDLPPAETVFVFGREVDDFHSVDYEEIAMLNISATQELHARVLDLQDENASLRNELKALRSSSAEFASLQDRLTAIESSMKKAAKIVAVATPPAWQGGAR